MADHLAPDELARLLACRRRSQRAQAEQQAAQADLTLCMLDLEDAYGIGEGDKIRPADGAILRVKPEPDAPSKNGAAAESALADARPA